MKSYVKHVIHPYIFYKKDNIKSMKKSSPCKFPIIKKKQIQMTTPLQSTLSIPNSTETNPAAHQSSHNRS